MIDDLRVHAVGQAAPRRGGAFVLYWMQGVSMRSQSNPALNFAVEQANDLGIPLLVYQGLRHDYPWASDRFHTFILEAATDLYRGFEARGIRYAFHLPSRDDRATPAPVSPLVELGRRAAVVVTDFFPTFIQPRQLRRLRTLIDTPVVAVDSATVVPMRFHTREYPVARSIRTVLHEALPHHLFAIPNPEPAKPWSGEVPFSEPLSSATTDQDIAALVSRCDIDHSVRPSTTIRGGERAAVRQLHHFLEHGLHRYTDQRNDPNVDATSRLSPYLHFGNIAIQDVLLATRAAGPAVEYAKFLDEALVWRELAHNFVYSNPRHRTMEAIPGWARQELEDHSDDPRPALYSADDLEQARTGDTLWNACQRSLLRDGELHNYLRMLWGKSVLQWTPDAATALRVLEHLNHKYALDGRDPNSYGGILWCFGRFDRPFYRRPIFGTVRYMSLSAARKKFDATAYESRYPASRP